MMQESNTGKEAGLPVAGSRSLKIVEEDWNYCLHKLGNEGKENAAMDICKTNWLFWGGFITQAWSSFAF